MCFLNQIRFQFHYGTIKSVFEFIAVVTQIYFNSTMVRLKENVTA